MYFLFRWPEEDGSEKEFEKYGRNRLAEGKLPLCAEMCSTKALLGGDGDVIADIFRTRVVKRGKGSEVWGGALPMARETIQRRSLSCSQPRRNKS
jgi:Fe-S-cluster-containing dehydrogenase component